MAVNFLNDVSLGSDIELQLASSSGGKMFANSKFYIQGDAINFRNYAGSETYAVFQNNGAVNLYYDNSKKFETTSSGVEVTGDVNLSGGNVIVGSQYGIRFNDANTRIYTNTDTPEDLIIEADQDLLLTPDGQVSITGNLAVTGDVADRDIPCWIGSNFLDGTSSVIYVVPFNNNSEATVSAKTYYHYATMPYAGQLKRVTFKNVSGTPSTSSFTVQLFLYVNGSQQTQSSEISWSNTNGITWSPTSSNTFSAGDEITIGYQKSTSSRTMAGVAAGIVVEFTDYDI